MFLLSTDIDGTIYDGPETARLFADYWDQLRNSPRPPVLVYNTGRSLADTLALIDSTDLPTPDFIIAGVGTEIFDFSKTQAITAWTDELSGKWNFETVRRVILDTVSGIEAQPDDCQNSFKCSWFWYDKGRDDIDRLSLDLFEAGVEAQVVYSSNRDLDILPINANKGNAVRWLASLLSFPPSQICVAGDSGNDSSMFLVEEVYGIVVSNAEPSLPAAVSGADIFHSSQPCAHGVIEGLRLREEQYRRSPN